MLSDFEVLDVISSKGKKNSIKILKALRSNTGEVVCLKTFKSHKFSIVQEALHEAKVLMTASKAHPNICEMKDCFVEQVHDFFRFGIVMQHFEHGDLEDEIKKRKRTNRPYSEKELLKIFEGLLDALCMLQKKQICHRDLKPQNIFVEHDSLLKIGDFGLSKKEEFGRLNSSKSLVGTPVYFSPLCAEAYLKHQLGGETRVSHNMYKSDVFSLGLTFLRMASLSSIRGLNCSPQALIEDRITGISYSQQVRSLLHFMLRVDENVRPDFLAMAVVNQELNSIMLSIQPDFIKQEDFLDDEVQGVVQGERKEEEVYFRDFDCEEREECGKDFADDETLESFGLFSMESIVVFKAEEFKCPESLVDVGSVMEGQDISGMKNGKLSEGQGFGEDIRRVLLLLDEDPKLVIVNANSIYLS
jgi:serine/threonine protein kinase